MPKVGIVGAGIAGLSHAYLLCKAGVEVTVFDQSAVATGASIRNFGMIWPIGQCPEIRPLALRSRELWLEASRAAGFSAVPCGSVHAVHHPLEMQVLREFASQQRSVEILTRSQVQDRCPLVRQEGLEGGMFSTTEVCVDPRQAIHCLAKYLETLGVNFHWRTPVSEVAPFRITSTRGETQPFDHVICAVGPELNRTDPIRWTESGMRNCRLQMLRLRPKTSDRIGTHLAFGLTLTHYANFADCPSLPKVRDLHASRWPSQTDYGIHILISEHADGTITLGDSHEYGESLPPYRKEDIDSAILTAADTFFQLDRYEIAERWEGVYPTHSEVPFYLDHSPGLTVINLFGTGMTLSFGVAEQSVKQIL